MPYSPIQAANTLLQRPFAAGTPITAQRLHALCYIAAVEYARRAGRDLFESGFTAHDSGPVQYSVFDKFRGLGDSGIEQYATQAGHKYVLNEREDTDLFRALDTAWARTRGVDTAALTVAMTQPGSAWFAARERGEGFIDAAAVAADTSYRAVV